MTRFLKREKWQFETACNPCVFNKYTTCPISLEDCIEDVFILVPRPPDGTRCRDFDGNIKVVGVDV
jgi:hypothetical protein